MSRSDETTAAKADSVTKPVRLLYITAEPWPTFRVDVSVLFGQQLPKYRVSSDLVTMRSGTCAEKPWHGGDTRLGTLRGGRARQHLATFWHILRVLFSTNWNHYDAVQVRDLPLPSIMALLLAKRHRRPFIFWMSFSVPDGQIQLAAERGLEAGLLRFAFPWLRGRVGSFILYRLVLPNADHIFVQSDQMKTDLIARGLSASRMTPVPMGVDLAALTADPIDPDIARQLAGRRVLVYLGQLERARRIEVLFDMLALLIEQFPDVVLLIVGDTEDKPQRARLRGLAERAGVADAVIWTGWVPMTTAWGYVQASEIGLSPIPRGKLLDCSSPTKLIEYLALGIPVVCNDNPDQARIMSECGAGRCVPYSADSFAAAVSELLTLDEESKERMKRAGYAYVAEHRDYPRIAATVAETYRSVCA